MILQFLILLAVLINTLILVIHTLNEPIKKVVTPLPRTLPIPVPKPIEKRSPKLVNEVQAEENLKRQTGWD